MSEAIIRVRRRRVLYVHGFDPRGPGPYHRLFRDQAAAQAAIDGATIDIGPRRAASPILAEWDVTSNFDGQGAQTRFGFLRWDDVARSLWVRGEGALWRELRQWVGDFARSGAFSYARRGARPGFWAMMTAPLYLILLMAVCLAAMSLTALAGVWGARSLNLPSWTGTALGLAPLLAIPLVWKITDRAWNISWLSRCFAFIALASRGRSQALVDRTESFAGEIIKACQAGDCDEVLVVGHSQGAPVAVMSLARALSRIPGLGTTGPCLSLLTLGQPISLWNQLAPAQGGFREDLVRVRDAADVFWLDVTSPSDGASACAIDPLDGVGRAGDGHPARRSPRFHMILKRETFRRIRRRPFDYHFQYLRAGDVPHAYDYFRLVCGPRTLDKFRLAWTAMVLERE